MKRVEINWVDSNIFHGWQLEGEQSCGLAVCKSLGYIKSEDDEKIVLTQTQSSYGAHMGVLAIPKGCIKSIKEMRMK